MDNSNTCLYLNGIEFQFGFVFDFLDYAAKGTHNVFLDGGSLFIIQSNNFTDEIGGIALIIGLLFVAFSKEKDEDERISQLRLESLLWRCLSILSLLFYQSSCSTMKFS